MTNEQKKQLETIEKKIKEIVNYTPEEPLTLHYYPDLETRLSLKELLRDRCMLLNAMFLCTPKEVLSFEFVNCMLNHLTKKMYEKAGKLYRSILDGGYDPGFDDDIVIEGSVSYVFHDKQRSVTWLEGEDSDSNEIVYGSDFPAMLEILFIYYGKGGDPDFAWCDTYYDLKHRPEMTSKELGLENNWDSFGTSWADKNLDREVFKDICICRAVYDILNRKYYSIPDLLRMNDFLVEVKATHKLISDAKGNRFSCIELKK